MAINSALAGAMAGQTSASLGKPVQQTDSTLKQALSNTNQRMSLINPFNSAFKTAAPLLSGIKNTLNGASSPRVISGDPNNLIQNADKANSAFESLIPKQSTQPGQILPKPSQNNQSFSPNYASQNNSSGYYNTDFGYSNYNPNTSGNTTFNNYSNNPGQQQNGTDNKPAPTSNPYADQLAALKSKIEELSTSVAKSGAPTDAEVQAMNDLDAAQSRLRNINASEQLGLSGIEQKPIALEFQTGQKAALQKQAAALAQAAGAEGETLAQKLARLQAQRTSNLDVNKTLLSKAQNEFTNLQTQAKPVEVNQGNSLVRFNPSTGQYETVVEGGNKQTDDIRNYEYAKQNGYQGGLLDFQREKIGMSSGAYDIQTDPATGKFYRINKLTGQVDPVSGVNGQGQFGEGGRALSAEQVQQISGGNQITSVLNPLYDLIKNKSNLFGPVVGAVNSRNPYNTDAATAQANLKTAAQTIGKYLEGGKLTDQDVPKYEAMLPKLTDTPAVAQNKLDSISTLLREKQQQFIKDTQSGGFNTNGYAVANNSSFGW